METVNIADFLAKDEEQQALDIKKIDGIKKLQKLQAAEISEEVKAQIEQRIQDLKQIEKMKEEKKLKTGITPEALEKKEKAKKEEEKKAEAKKPSYVSISPPPIRKQERNNPYSL